MNPYDQAHALAKSLKESEEYREMMRLRGVAYESDTNRALLDEIALFLLQKETITGDEFMTYVNADKKKLEAPADDASEENEAPEA